MRLVRWDPFRELLNIHDSFARSVDGAYGSWTPAVDILERNEDLIVRAELPGVEKDDIDVRVEENRLVLEGERRRESEVEDETVHRLERSYGKFVRSFELPKTVDSGRITAAYQNGILEVVLPKAEQARSRRIDVNAA